MQGRSPQTFALGFKELWQLPAGRGEPGLVQHSLGWPLDNASYGGSFVYHLDDDQVYVGYVVGLDYQDPRLSPVRGLPAVQAPSRRCAPLLEGGEMLAAGARTIAAGGWQSCPRLDMPGAMLVGDAGGHAELREDQGHPPGAYAAACWRQSISQATGGSSGLRRALARIGGRT